MLVLFFLSFVEFSHVYINFYFLYMYFLKEIINILVS